MSRTKIARQGVLGLAVTMLLALCGWTASAQDQQIDPERQALYDASRALSEERQQEPTHTLGVVVTNYKAVGVTVGARVEMFPWSWKWIRLVGEAIHLDEENALAGFVSLKTALFHIKDTVLYAGGGFGLSDATEAFQGYVGLDVDDRYYFEGRYTTDDWNAGEGVSSWATGFKLSF